MGMKSLTTTFSARERFSIWLHLTRNVQTNSGREQDQIDDIWTSLKLDEIGDRVEEATEALGPRDFSEERALEVELARDELSCLLGKLVTQMPAALSRVILPIRRRLCEERDAKGMKAPAED
jgi:hypothetical protein